MTPQSTDQSSWDAYMVHKGRAVVAFDGYYMATYNDAPLALEDELLDAALAAQRACLEARLSHLKDYHARSKAAGALGKYASARGITLGQAARERLQEEA